MGDQKAKSANDRFSLRRLGGRPRPSGTSRQVLPATPAARRYAQEKDVDLQELSEIGMERRITERDIDIYLEKKKIFEKRAQNGRRQDMQETLGQPEEPKLETAEEKPTETDEPAARKPGDTVTEGELEVTAEAAPAKAETSPEIASTDHPADETQDQSTAFHLDDFDPSGVSVVSVSPLARELAEEHHVDLSKLAPGSGPNGRIVRYDVRQWLKAQPDTAEGAKPPKEDAAPAPEAEPQAEAEPAVAPKESQTPPEAPPSVNHPDPVAAKIYRAIRDNMADSFTQKAPPVRAKAADVAASAMAEKTSPQGEALSRLAHREDPDDAVAIGPYALDMTVDVTRIHDACRNQSEKDGAELTDYVAAAAARAMSLHPKACGAGTEIVLMTLSEAKGLVCTPGMDADAIVSPKAFAAQRRQVLQEIEMGRLDVSDAGVGLHILSLGQGVGVNYICDKQRAPVLSVGAVRKDVQIGGMHYIASLTLSQKRGAANVAASVAFLNALKTLLENPDALFQMKPKEEK